MPASLARVSFSQAEYRRTPPLTDLRVKDRDALSTELVMSTLIEKGTDAQAFQREIFDLRRSSRYDWNLLVLRDTVTLNIGDTITVYYPRFGLQDGKNFIVKRIKRNHASPYLELSLFGPQA